MRSTEIKVGLFVIIAGVAAAVVVVWLSRVRWGSTFDIAFGEISGLEKGVPVRLGGVAIGDVTDIFIKEVSSQAPAPGDESDGPPAGPAQGEAEEEAGKKERGAVPAQPRFNVIVRVTLSSRNIALPKPNQAPSKGPKQEYLYTSYRYLIAGGSLLGAKSIAISSRDREGRTIPVTDEQILRQGKQVRGEDPIVLEDVLGKVSAIAQSVSNTLDETTTARMREAIVDLAVTAQEARRLMNSVNQSTGESGEKLVHIVSNVEQATGTLNRLLADNQAQVQRMLTHLASASARIDQVLGRSGPDFRRLTQNLAATSASLQRVVTANEANFNRLVQGLTDTTDSVQRMLRDNEQEVRRTLTSLADTSETVQRTLSQNEANFNRLVQGLTDTTDSVQRMLQDNQQDVQRMVTSLADTSETVQRTLSQNEARFDTLMENLTGLTTDLRQTLSGSQNDLRALTQNLMDISGTVRGMTQEVQDELQRTAAHLDQLTGHVNELVAGNKDNIDQIVSQLNQLSKNMTAVSGRLETFLQNDQWTTDLQQSLANLRSTSENAAATMESLRGLLTDTALQGHIRGTLQNLEQATAQGQSVLEKADRWLGGDPLGDLGEPQWQVDWRYRPETDHFRTDVNVRLGRKDGTFWQIGWEDATVGDRSNLQYGWSIRPQQTLRAGLYRSRLGVGWEYDFGRRGNLVVDFFDPNEAQLNLRTHYRFHRDWQWSLGMEDLGGARDFIGGVRYAPEGD